MGWWAEREARKQERERKRIAVQVERWEARCRGTVSKRPQDVQMRRAEVWAWRRTVLSELALHTYLLAFIGGLLLWASDLPRWSIIVYMAVLGLNGWARTRALNRAYWIDTGQI